MFAQCTQKSFAFHTPQRQEGIAQFNGGHISSDGGALLLQRTEQRTGILAQFARCFTDHRDPELIEHTVLELLTQRIFALALGYEDLNDHDDLRHDPLLATVVGKADPTGTDRARQRDKGKALAGKSTLNRLELTPVRADRHHRYKKIVVHQKAVEQLLIDLFLQAHHQPPEQIVLDFDATDDPVHGDQLGRFFHGYYKHYCYLPLYVFCGDHLLCAKLRPSNIDAAMGTVKILRQIVQRIRATWPQIRIVVRADSGFCREPIMAWCEANQVDYVLGLAKNKRLTAAIDEELAEAQRRYQGSGQAARLFKDFMYQTLESWRRPRRVIGKAEHLNQGANPRFIVTSLGAQPGESSCGMDARSLYEQLYCARGDMENRIKEQQLALFADRTSAATMRANQVRLWFASIAYTMLAALRRLGLKDTTLAQAQCQTIRLKLLKIGALIRVTCRKVWVSLSQSYPYQALFTRVWMNLAGAGPPRVQPAVA